MKVLSATAVMHVVDLERAIKLYTGVLGFNLDFRFGNYAGLACDQVSIHLCGPLNQGIKKTPGSGHLCIDCDEVDAYYQLISEKGAQITVPIGDRGYGVRDFAVADDDGNILVFGKSIS